MIGTDIVGSEIRAARGSPGATSFGMQPDSDDGFFARVKHIIAVVGADKSLGPNAIRLSDIIIIEGNLKFVGTRGAGNVIRTSREAAGFGISGGQINRIAAIGRQCYG